VLIKLLISELGKSYLLSFHKVTDNKQDGKIICNKYLATVILTGTA